jgi:uroporphyrinogen-III synthase
MSDPDGSRPDVDGEAARDLREIASHRGMKALVTRPREESESLASALASRGVGAVIEPMMRVHYSVTAALDLTAVQAILCTSANGARALARVTSERRLPLFAVGETTAARARAEGFTAVESAGGTLVDLVALVTERLDPRNGGLLHVAGNVVAGDLVDALRARGFVIERSILYEARPVGALSASAVRALRCGIIDLALFFSPRTAAIFVRLANIAGVVACCRTITALAISPAADAVLAALPWRNRLISQRPNQRALLDALDSALAEQRQGQP